MVYLITRSAAVFLFRVLFRIQIFGQNNIPLKGGFILASNHLSYLDPPALAVACPRVLSFLAKEELFRNSLFARFLTNVNAFPIQSQAGDFKSLRRAIRELEQGKALVIFPEGTRIADGQFLEPMAGVGLLAAKAAAPIVPVFIEGSNLALPIHAKFIRLKKIKVYFGRPIRLEELDRRLDDQDTYQKIAAKTMEEIARLKRMVA